MSQLTDYMENKFVDWYWRGQSFTPPATRYFALFTAAPGETGGGTEASYTGYARVGVAASLANFAGTQSAGSTTASSGTGGQTSNNGAITFGAPGSGPQTVTHGGTFDASSSGNLLDYHTLSSSRTLNNGDSAPSYAAGAFTGTVA
jgi:hypothetical protein